LMILCIFFRVVKLDYHKESCKEFFEELEK
jgi:hypothetical protein